MSTKTPADVLALLEKRLIKVWARAAVGVDHQWGARIPLGALTSTELARDLATHAKWARDWVAWAGDHDVELDVRHQRVDGTVQQIPNAVTIPDADAAARLVGEPWPLRLARGRARAQRVREELPATEMDLIVRVVRETDAWTDLDVGHLITAAHWFTGNDATGKTPRQVAIGGLHAKWLNTSQHLVAGLAGRDTLGLSGPHPSVIHFAYLDPDYLSTGGRRYDSYAVADNWSLPYSPRIVLICENKDCVVTFGDVPGAIAVEGNGAGAAPFAATPWIRDAPLVVYWGDMDADGLAILGQFRAAGIVNASMLMDLATYEAYQADGGTRYDKNGKELTAGTPNPGLDLTDNERELYEMLLDPEYTGYRRLEQEHIPDDVAHRALLAVAAG
ncbi:Wadjet anti-phage system protein JetD domain-containing protein [Isoptericola sp. NPDC019571]|uniref:Wadjet anti-phage system protein JetD domain-containing protein n=1 Tax=Isoptericola sp. NPDC019571 TaxID=3364008 RepID=UPI0037ACC1DD